MKLTYILPDKEGGVASVVRKLVSYSSIRDSINVILLRDTEDKFSTQIQWLFECERQICVKYSSYWDSKYSICKRISEHINSDSIIISNDGGIELEMVKIIKLTNPVVFILHGDLKHYFNAISIYNNLIDTIIAVSDYLKERVKVTFREVQSSKVYSIKSPVQAIKIHRTNNEDLIRLAFVGSLLKAKGVYNLVDITKYLNKLKTPYTLSIIGDGPEMGKLKQMFNTNKRVRFFGFTKKEDIDNLHNNHDIILLPSLSEGLPIAIVEGMLAGVVPISNALESGIPEIVIDDITGFKIINNKPELFAETIHNLHLNRKLLNKLSEQCILFATKNFEPKTQTYLFESAYLSALRYKKQPYLTSTFDLKQITNYLPQFISYRISKLLRF